jgi:GT2 family glycosyltransferase
MTIRVSVIVPTYRRDELLQRCLQALLVQTFPASEYEIIIADNGGDPATARLVRDASQSSTVDLKYLKAAHVCGPAAARNRGWKAASGSIIAFTDDDCIPDPSWLENGLQTMSHGTDAVAGRVVMPLPVRPTHYERDAAGLTTGEFVTANCFCRKSALEAVGGFDERFTAAWREDSDLQFSLLAIGKTIVRAENAVVVHPIRPAPWGICLLQEKKTRFDPLLYKKHPALYRERIPELPRGYYAILSSLGVALTAVFAGSSTIGLFAFFIWLGFTGRLCYQRLGGTSRAPGHVVEVLVTAPLVPFVSVYWRLRGLIEHGTFFF